LKLGRQRARHCRATRTVPLSIGHSFAIVARRRPARRRSDMVTQSVAPIFSRRAALFFAAA
jgi:hypothetical protein